MNNVQNENTAGGFGALRINAYIGSRGTPAAGARVTVSSENNTEISYNAITNESGQGGEIRLPTPPASYSDSADMPRPFNEYNVTAEFSGEIVLIKNVQLYPDTTAIQNIIFSDRYEAVSIPYPVLWGKYPEKIPESEIKRLPDPGGLVVLPKPVVPEFIVVHDGIPSDANADNYTVGYRDYIKNVASSEIYSSWPRETLKANIVAINSFTLNRVYTEWYRSKGYDFTITSSTAYDQSFSYGRNIYREISDIVDEVFDLYVSKTDVAQPLFTQYCDGIRVNRRGWLSQWGSKDLGDRGLSALQILRSYYGYDISLRQAERVEGVPLSFQGVLRSGSVGEAVRTIQNQLNTISGNYPRIPRLSEDGIFGPRTKNAVEIFQQVFSLPVTGVVDFSTWYSVSNIYNAVRRASGS